MPKRKACPVGRFVSVDELDANKIAPRLWQGGLGDYEGCKLAIRRKDFDIVVVLAPDAEVKLYSSKDGKEFPEVIEFALRDEKSDLDYLPELVKLSKYLAKQIKRGKTVLCACRQGWNRSSLLVCATLLQLYPKLSGKQISKTVKSRRKYSLSNPHFEKFIESIP
jgi:Dual specificity phosphatase, catalytic domain.